MNMDLSEILNDTEIIIGEFRNESYPAIHSSSDSKVFPALI